MQPIQLPSRLRRLFWSRQSALGLGLGACVVVAVTGAALLAVHAQDTAQAAPNGQPPRVQESVIHQPDTSNEERKTGGAPARQPDVDAASAERKAQLSDESARLLTLAVALKAEVDKTNKDMLSLNVIRKAEEIEKLAHDVKAKMKLSAGGS